MRRFRSGLWAVAVSWLGSAFIHANDPDIGGVSGLWVPPVLASISGVAIVIAIPALLCCAAFARRSWRGLLVSSAAFALGMGCVLAFAGFGGDTTKSWFVSFGGLSVMFWLVLLVATMPFVWVSRLKHHAEPEDS